jgi:para-aminobenzoate synthetase component 1
MSDVLVREIAWRTPERAFLGFAGEDRLVWFDSQATGDARGRYSALCIDPFGVLEVIDGRVLCCGVEQSNDPFAALQAVIRSWPVLRPDLPVPFGGGAAGFFGYELGRHLERLPAPRTIGPRQPEMWIGFYDVVLAFDHLEQRCWLISSGLPETTPAARRLRAQARLDAIFALIEMPVDPGREGAAQLPRALPAVAWQEDLDPAAYVARVREALGLIEAGDIFQVNLTTRHAAQLPAGLDAQTVHLALRRESPAPFGAFLRATTDFAVSCVSPERFLCVDREGRIETRPIKGTRPRHADPAEDARLRRELFHSEKDRAENLMIVDLMRNDLGRVSAPGSVRVDSLQQVESFASVHHMVSSVTGRLLAGQDAVGLLRASFPGGSVTGAPKIRAMEIIHALEPAPRGVYCGAIAWFGFDGAMDSNIVIRSLVMTGGQVIAQAGGAIVADSDPESEHAEMMTKIAPLRRIFGRNARS